MTTTPVPEATRIAAQPRDPIAHPITGEILPDDIKTLQAAEETVDRYLRRLSPHYRFRAELRERIAELQGPALLPKPRARTDRQARVAACPRCGRKD